MGKPFAFIIAVLAFMPLAAFAQSSDAPELFEARVIEVREGEGAVVEGTRGDRKGETYVIPDLAGFEVASAPEYREGDRVIVAYSPGPDGGAYYITDFVRTSPLWLLFGLFVLAVLFVGRKKGLRALLMLCLTALVILKFIVPLILAGWSPPLVAVIGSVAILSLAIFGTEGFGPKSRIAFVSVLIAMALALLLSWIFTEATRLTGISSDEAMTLFGLAEASVDLKGLLLAGIVIGTLGVLDDVVVSQVSVVAELREADRNLDRRELFRRAMNVGVDHINAVVNTLFLAYAGVAMPLLVLFSVDIPPFITIGQTINNEIVATEVVRTLVGSIALVMAVPIATWVAARHFAVSTQGR